jgi:flavin-dependent dehydrogenase
MMIHQYDVVILGGGPAGSATALALRKRDPSLSVAIVERSAYDGTRVGETLSPGVRPLLEHLGVWSTFREQGFLPAYGTCAAWGSDDLYTNDFIFTPHGRGWHLDRRAFDAMLAQQAVAQGTALYTDTRMTAHHRLSDGRWRLTLCTRDRASLDLEAAFVVDATGRVAAFARRQGARTVDIDRLVGVFVFFEVETSQQDTSTLVEAVEAGWWYSALLPDAQMVVACMSDADLVRKHHLNASDRWTDWLDQTRHTRERLSNATPCTEPRVYAAHSQRLDSLTGDGWLAVGDAASTFDPLSSQGIFKALRSGIFAAYAVCDTLNGDARALTKYHMLLGQEFKEYLETWQDYYRQEQRWPDSAFWQRRIGHTAPGAHKVSLFKTVQG